MKKILLPTDFSKNALNAIIYALDMFREEKVTFTILNSYKVFDYHEQSKLTVEPGDQSLEKARKEVENKLKHLVDDLKAKAGKGHTFKIAAYNLLLVEAINRELRKQKHHLIVIGTQGHTGDSEVIYGSNTINIMEEVEKCPVLAVPGHSSYIPLKEIVLANSFKVELTPNDMDFLIGLAKKFGSAIRILHIAEEGGLSRSQKYNRKQLQEKLEGVKHSFHFLEYLSVPMGIYSFLESRGSDMIAFVNKKHTLIQNLLMQPLYKNLAHFSKVPVLVLHQPMKKQ